MNEIKLTGGARIGMLNASWPFATLTISRERLELNASIIGRYAFRQGDIVTLEPYGVIPVIGRGVKINHRVPDYKKKVIFWSFKNPNEVISLIRQSGFLDGAPARSGNTEGEMAAERRRKGGFPFRISFIAAVFVIWNMLISIDIAGLVQSDGKENWPGIGSMAGALFMFAASALLLVSKRFRRAALKEGFEFDDISKFIFFVLIVTGFMLVCMTVLRTSID